MPPTLVSFATAIGKAGRVISTEFKKPESTVVLVRPILDPETGCPNFFSLKANYKMVEQLIEEGMVAAACSVGYGGLAEALFKMGLGNRIGFKMMADKTTAEMFAPMYGSIVLEMVSDSPAGELLGETTKDYTFECCGETLDMAELQEIWESKLEPVYPYRKAGANVDKINGRLEAPAAAPKIGVAKPKVIIPVFPGTNCEYDTAHAFARAGADPEILVIRNLTPADVTASCEALVKAIGESQIVMLPGGFSGGDEPDGSAKFIASFFRNPAVTEAVRELLQKRDGLMLGICNGFQALIKLGLVPYGDIRPITSYDPTLTFNTIGRHQSMLVRTRIASTGSPWLSNCAVGDEHTRPSATARAASWLRRTCWTSWSGTARSPHSMWIWTASPPWISATTPTARSSPSRASPARMAVSSARWATPSAAVSTCTRTSRVTSTSRSLRAA